MTTVEAPTSKPPLLGSRMLRKEDPALLTGEARFTSDLSIPGALHLAVVRSPYAHARIDSVDLAAALAAPGVVAAYCGADLEPHWSGGIPCVWAVTPDMKSPLHLPVAVGKACFVGDIVAVVLARSETEARDAADAVRVEYTPLAAVVDLTDAASDRVVVHEGLGTNRSYTWELHPQGVEAVNEAFASAAAHTVKERYVQQRLIPMAMEPRAVAVVPSPYGGDVTVYSSTQIPHILRLLLSLVLGIAEQRIRVVAPSVGGGFGSKLDLYPEELICTVLADKHRLPVRWVETRTENAQATIHGRGQIQEIELAADASGKLQAVRVNLLADMGAYFQIITPGIPLLGAFLYAGVYDVPNYSFSCTGVFTTMTPTDAYRGAGRPEATYAIERAMDSLADQLGLDPAELRLRNMIRHDQFPYTAMTGLTYDSGNHEGALAQALEISRYSDLRADQQARRTAGSTVELGIGISSYFEMCGLAPSRVLASLNYVAGGWESATVRLLPTGKVQVVTGSSPHGQGHVTAWSMIAADRLGIDPADVEVLHGDTAISPLGLDTYGSRSLSVGGIALVNACDKVIDKARLIAAHQLECAADDVEFVGGEFRVKGTPSRAMSIAAVAFEAFSAHNLPDGLEPNLMAEATYDPPNFSWPGGTHICVVEVDTETGKVEILRYIAVDDCGTQINPMIVEGQIHGGIIQGIAQALFEEAVYDSDGNLRTSNLADYLVPAACDVPSLTLGLQMTPSPTNPLGVKGIGEAGTIGSAPAVINAVVDALSRRGVHDIAMPASPQRVWEALNSAATAGGAK